MVPSRIFTAARKWLVLVADDALHGSNKFIAPVRNPATTALGIMPLQNEPRRAISTRTRIKTRKVSVSGISS